MMCQQLNQIILLEQQYQQIKSKMYHQKLLGKLTQNQLEQLCNLINIIAMKYSNYGQHQNAVQWLNRAIKYSGAIPKAKMITFNNIACVYRKLGNLESALLYIKKAQKQANQLLQNNEGELKEDLKIFADCSLNLCAILSSMKEHSKALRAVRKGILALEQFINNENISSQYLTQLYPLMKYNEGVQLEQLKNLKQAKQSYEKSLKYCHKQSQLFMKIKKALSQIQQKGTPLKIAILRTNLSNTVIGKYRSCLGKRQNIDHRQQTPSIKLRLTHKSSRLNNQQNYRSTASLHKRSKGELMEVKPIETKLRINYRYKYA